MVLRQAGGLRPSESQRERRGRRRYREYPEDYNWLIRARDEDDGEHDGGEDGSRTSILAGEELDATERDAMRLRHHIRHLSYSMGARRDFSPECGT